MRSREQNRITDSLDEVWKGMRGDQGDNEGVRGMNEGGMGTDYYRESYAL